MKQWLFIFFLLTTLFSEAQNIDVIHYKYEIAVNDSTNEITGSAKIDVKFLWGGNGFSLNFFQKNMNGKGMQVTNVSGAAAYAQHDNDLAISLGENWKKEGDTATITISYRGIPDDGLIISKNKYGDRTFFADNWPNRAHHWIPCVDRPDDKASFEFIVRAPSRYNVISNGIEIEEKEPGDGNKLTHWKEDTPQPAKVMVIGVARFAVKTFDDSPAAVPVSAWVYPQDSTKGFYDYGLAPEILKFYSNYIAPYPYRKLANVQSKTIFGGMENASAIFYAESSVTGDRSSEDLLAHEIAHQWFGDAASEKSFAHLWLSEGFATYFTNLYFENKYGRDAMIGRLKKDREDVIAFAKTSLHPVVDSTRDLMSLLNTNSYQKGGWILHMLRNEVGDTMFQKIIRAYYNRYKGGNADTRDFEAVAEKVSGKDLKWFFDQWLYRPGIPRIAITKAFSEKGIQLTIVQLQKDLYQLTLPVTVETAGKSTTKQVPINARTRSVIISLDEGAKIIIDPNNTLLFEEIEQ